MISLLPGSRSKFPSGRGDIQSIAWEMTCETGPVPVAVVISAALAQLRTDQLPGKVSPPGASSNMICSHGGCVSFTAYCASSTR